MHHPRLIQGSITALEAALAAEVDCWRERDPFDLPLVLVGNPALQTYLRRRIATGLGSRGHLGLQIVTPNRLAQQLGVPVLLEQGRTPLPGGAARVLAEAVALQAQGYFQPVAQTPGFAQALSRLFVDLREAAISPEALQRVIAEAEVSPEKLTALATLYADAERRRAPFYDVVDAYAAADLPQFTAPAVLVYGITHFPTILRQVLEQLMARVPVIFFLPWTGSEADRAYDELRIWLSRFGVEPETLPETVPDREPTALDHLHQTLFRRQGGVAPDDSVRLLSAPDPAREAREAVRACLAWAERDGIPFHEMAVVYRHEEPYRALLDEAFREAGIPVYLADGRPLADHPQGRRLLALLDLAGSPLRRADVMAFLTETTLPEAIAQEFGAIEPAAWDAISRDAGIVEGREQWRDRLRLLDRAKRRAALGDDDGDLERINERLSAELETIERLSRFIDDFAERLVPPSGPQSWGTYVAYLRALAERYIDGIEPVLDEIAQLDRLTGLVEPESFRRFQRTVRMILEQIKVDQVPALRWAEPGGNGAEPRRPSLGRYGVNVLPVHTLRYLRFRAVVILGLAERSFPARPRQDALLLDRERARLNTVAGWELPLRTAVDTEPLLFLLAVKAATERLLLSYPRGEGSEARSQFPSYFFRAAAEALVGRRVSIEEVDTLPEPLFIRVRSGQFGAACPEEALSLQEYDRTLLAQEPLLGMACLEQVRPAFGRARRAWAARWRDSRLTPYDGVLSDAARAAIERRAGLWRAISPSRLETYATCPYRFFLMYLLRLDPVEEPDLLERIEGLERGALVHDVLERFLTACGPDDPPSAERREAHLAQLLAIATEECDDREQRGLVGYPLLWQIDRKVILEDLIRWYDAEVAARTDAYRPTAFELRFGPKWRQDQSDSALSIDEPIEVEAGEVTLKFQGRIDRIDLPPGRTAFRVIDYKTGRRPSHHKDGAFSGGRALQLPIYLLAASHVLDIAWERGEADYFYVSRRGEFRRVRVDGATLKARWETFTSLLSSLATGIAKGQFHPVPGPNGEHCRFCDYQDVCGVRIVRLAERKAADPRAVEFAQLAEVE